MNARARGNQEYYDAFSDHYEDQRGRGYHQLLDDLEVGLVERYGRDRDVLEAGCGTGLILERVAGFARRAVGIDLSRGMLRRSVARGLDVVQASITELPFPAKCFDVVCSFKVLAHVEAIDVALAEMTRVVRPSGHLLLEFYNPISLRGLVKALKPPERIADGLHDGHVYTRFDTPWAIARRLPPSLKVVGWRGVRVLTPIAAAHRVPLVGAMLDRAERLVADTPLGFLGGFLIVVAQRQPAP